MVKTPNLNYGDDSNIFNPQILMKMKFGEIKILWISESTSARFSPFTYPPRDCIGKNFAQLEMRLILLYLLRDYTFVLTDKQLLNAMDDNYLGSNRATMGPVDV